MVSSAIKVLLATIDAPQGRAESGSSTSFRDLLRRVDSKAARSRLRLPTVNYTSDAHRLMQMPMVSASSSASLWSVEAAEEGRIDRSGRAGRTRTQPATPDRRMSRRLREHALDVLAMPR